MIQEHYITRIGGDNYQFPHTQWTLINNTEDHKKVVEEYIFNFYWKPLYFYLIRKGITNEQAKDYTQSFLYEILYGKEFLSKADRTKGRFRSFLLTSFNNYIKASYRKDKMRDKIVGMPDYDVPKYLPSDPSDAFEYTWALNILEQVIEQVRTQCADNDLAVHWQVFEEKILLPLLENKTSPSMAEICQKYKIVSESAASNMIVTVKRRFQKTLLAFLSANTPDSDTRKNYQEFFEIFSKK